METDWAHLLAEADHAAESAWCPYSGYQVGALLITEQGGIYRGCNVENASYGLTQCAERTAICTAVAAEGKGMRIARLAVVARGAEFPPCGACRQVIAEFSSAATEVGFRLAGEVRVMRLAELLPESFALR